MSIRAPRRRLVVDPRFQSAVISSFLLVFVPATAVLWAVSWSILLEVEALGQALGLSAGHPFFERLEELRAAAAVATLVTLAGVIALVVYGGLLLTRRIAGPILAIRRRLEQAGQGEEEIRVHARRGDYFAELLLGLDRLIAERQTLGARPDVPGSTARAGGE
jgi:hypothetical protein